MRAFWFLVEGEGRDTGGVVGRFGFYVNCVVQTESEHSAETLIRTSLAKDRLSVNRFEDADAVENLVWTDERVRQRMQELIRQARLTPQEPCFGSFHTWPKER